MFKCTECSEEYKIKPDYCKCGNDEFVEIITSTNPEEISEFTHKTNSKFEFPIKKLIPIGYIFLCIILAIIPWLFKSNQHPIKPEEKVAEKVSQNIPDIETLWQNSENSVQNEPKKNIPTEVEPKKSEKPQNIIDNLIKKSSEQQKQKNIATPAPKKIEQQKPKSTTTSAQQKQQTKQTPKPSTTQKPKNTTQNLPKPTQTTTNIVSQPTQKTQTAPKPQPKPEPPKMNAQEFLEYKGQIRSALLSKLDITAIQGIGDCAVEFSIDNTGKLINRNFIYKSSNKTLNDEVYLMLMRLPYFKTPPANYRGEKIKLKFYINNGYYEITFI